MDPVSPEIVRAPQRQELSHAPFLVLQCREAQTKDSTDVQK